jgi:hypothetical protein
MQRRSFTQGLLLGAIAAAGRPGFLRAEDAGAQWTRAIRRRAGARAVAGRLEDGRSRVTGSHPGDHRGALAQ